MPITATIGVSSALWALPSEARIRAENMPERSATAAPSMMVSTRPSGAKPAKVRGISANRRAMFSCENRLAAR